MLDKQIDTRSFQINEMSPIQQDQMEKQCSDKGYKFPDIC